MDHMQHLESVALSDCAVLETKEGTYKGSWKRAGGASAWFMARRNLDRLITMMAPKEFPEYIQTVSNVRDTVMALDNIVHYQGNGLYGLKDLPGTIEASRSILAMLLDRYTSEDIFMKIRENPGGEDGTVLACLRDARRYFMLVEAEMIAEGVVEPESKTYEMDDEHPTSANNLFTSEWDGKRIETFILKFGGGNQYTWSNVTRCLIERSEGTCTITIDADGKVANAERDPYEVVAEQNGMTVSRLKECLLDWKHLLPVTPPPLPSNGGYAAEQAERHPMKDRLGALLRIGDLCTWARPEDGAVFIVELAGTEDGKPVIKGEPAVPPEGRQTEWSRLRRDSTQSRRDMVSDGGSHHAVTGALEPWHVSQATFMALCRREGVGAELAERFYTRRAADVFQLEPVVIAPACPREVAPAFEFLDGGRWILKRDRIPREIEDNFPQLQREMNNKEFEESPRDFQFMYEQNPSDLKWIIHPRFATWARDAA